MYPQDVVKMTKKTTKTKFTFMYLSIDNGIQNNNKENNIDETK